MSRQAAFILLAWLLALTLVAVLLDRPVAEWVRAHPPYDKHGWFAFLAKLPGYFPFTLGVAALLGLLHPRRWSAALLVLLSGLAGGLLYCVVKWLVGRHRPTKAIEPFRLTPLAGGLRGLFVSPPNLSFPSGHATLSFASAAALGILLPRWRWAFYAVATVVAAERVLENAHYVSDVIAGAGFGILTAYGVRRLLVRLTRQPPEGGAAPEGFPVILKDAPVSD